MFYRRSISLLLAALLLAQAVLAGWSSHHCHHHPAAIAEHAHSHSSADGRVDGNHADEPEELPPAQSPTDEDDCTLCRFLAESSLLTVDCDLAPAGQLDVPVVPADGSLACHDIVGLRRPRSPPALG